MTYLEHKRNILYEGYDLSIIITLRLYAIDILLFSNAFVHCLFQAIFNMIGHCLYLYIPFILSLLCYESSLCDKSYSPML